MLKWAGGKRQLANEILRRAPKEFGTYYEPFVGAGAILFSCMPNSAVINDMNQQLYYLYTTIRDDVEGLISELEIHSKLNSKDYFYSVREREREFDDISSTEKAARLIYLNKTCYNGLYRVT